MRNEKEDLVFDVVKIIEDKKGEKTVVLDVKEISTYTDYLLITTANSERQIIAIKDAIYETLKKKYRLSPLSIEGEKKMRWLLMDYLDFIVHIFLPDVREYYRLEDLWQNEHNRIYP